MACKTRAEYEKQLAAYHAIRSQGLHNTADALQPILEEAWLDAGACCCVYCLSPQRIVKRPKEEGYT